MANVTVAGNCIVFVGDVECIHICVCASNRINGVLSSNSSFPVSCSHLSLNIRRHKLILSTCVSVLQVSIDIILCYVQELTGCSEHD